MTNNDNGDCVSIQKLRTVVLDYGELLAQLVYLTDCGDG